MALFRNYLQLEGIPGSSKDPRHVGWLNVDSWSLSPKSLEDLAFVTRDSRAACHLYNLSRQRDVISQGMLEVTCRGGVFKSFPMTEIVIVDVQMSQGNEGEPLVAVALHFENPCQSNPQAAVGTVKPRDVPLIQSVTAAGIRAMNQLTRCGRGI